MWLVKNKILRGFAPQVILVAGTVMAVANSVVLPGAPARKPALSPASLKSNPVPHPTVSPKPTPTHTPTPAPTPVAQVTKIVFSEGGSVFVTGDSSGTVQVREAATGALRRTWSVGESVRGIAAAAGSRRLLIDSVTKLTQWDIPSGALVSALDDGVGVSGPNAIGPTPNDSGGLLAASGSRFYGRFSSHGIVLTNYVFGDTYSFEIAGGVCYALSPGARILAVGCAAPQAGITFFDLFGRRQLLTCHDAGLDSGVMAMAFARDGKSVISVQNDGSVLQSSADTGATTDLHLGIARPNWVVTGAQFNADTETLAVAARETTSAVTLGTGVRVFDLRDGRLVSKFPGVHSAFALSPDADRLVVAFRDGTTTLFGVATGRPIASWSIDPAPVPQRLLSALEPPEELQLLLDRNGLGFSAKRHYVLRQVGDRFQVTADIENPRAGAAPQINSTVSSDAVRKFIVALADCPCTPGRYTPLIEHPDDNVHFVIVFHSGVRTFSLYTDSQGVDGMPWGLTMDGKDYTINSMLPGQALDALLPALAGPPAASGK